MTGNGTRTASFVRANVIGSIFFVGVALIGTFLHAWIWDTSVIELLDAFYLYSTLPAVGMLLLGIVVHELLHGVGFKYLAGASWRDIKFGIHFKYLVPYATTKVPMTIEAYRGATALPGIVTGVVPLVVGLATGSAAWTLFGMVLLGGAGGDALILWYVRALPAGTIVRDSESLIGCEVVEITPAA